VTDLAIFVPSRRRPKNVARLVDACARTCRTAHMLVFGFDEDDPDLEAGIAAAAGARYQVKPRMGLAEWTNVLAAAHMDAAFLGSIGDDMVPVTDGWDERLITAIEHNHDGVGMAYPNDLVRTDIPEAIVMSTPIVKGLGWMALPDCQHWCIDDAWRDLGAGAGCLSFCESVIVEHRHWHKWMRDPTVTHDATYTDAETLLGADRNAYRKWRLTRMRADIGTVRVTRAALGVDHA
jgi:hypothetical protein